MLGITKSKKGPGRLLTYCLGSLNFVIILPPSIPPSPPHHYPWLSFILTSVSFIVPSYPFFFSDPLFMWRYLCLPVTLLRILCTSVNLAGISLFCVACPGLISLRNAGLQTLFYAVLQQFLRRSSTLLKYTDYFSGIHRSECVIINSWNLETCRCLESKDTGVWQWMVRSDKSRISRTTLLWLAWHIKIKFKYNTYKYSQSQPTQFWIVLFIWQLVSILKLCHYQAIT